MTREHIFRSSWRDKLDIGPPRGDRDFAKISIKGEIKSTRPEPLFDVTVKWVCDHCNNGWMNSLDSAVEPWIFDPYAEANQCDPQQFRRWATKVAVLRSHYEHPVVPQDGDFDALYQGVDIADWHEAPPGGRTSR